MRSPKEVWKWYRFQWWWAQRLLEPGISFGYVGLPGLLDPIWQQPLWVYLYIWWRRLRVS